ncbi:NAD(P)H-dependent oxidoreductase, partial [Escherichia coli]|uniref:NAD(P)H-dependent oxidoreductase n=1 Tax=Escherichia coli TaxID=562 RepID=UPI00191BF3BD
ELLVVAAPVHRGSYPGLFKHLIDFIELDALVDTPVLLAATGGSERHALVIDHQLRPLFSFLQAHTLPIGVYATPADFDGEHINSAALQARIAPLRHRESQLRNALAFLLAQPPQALDAQLQDARRDWPALPALAVGPPSELAERRPDIPRAEAALHAATASIGAAKASFLPRIT